MTIIYIIIGAILLVPIISAILQISSATYMRVVERTVRESGMSDVDQRACLDSMDAARESELPVILKYDIWAPLVMLLVLPFVKRDANKLPDLFRKWDNNVSINGDSGGVYNAQTGQWIGDYDVKDWTLVQPEHGWHHYTYDDPLYDGDAYYAKGHHPRSFWARWIWLGFRNRATKASFDVGINSTEPAITVAEGDGWTIKRSGKLWEVFSLRNGVRVYYGWKVYEAPGCVRPVTIGYSLRYD